MAGATALFTLLRPYRPLETPSAAGTVREIRDGIVYAVRRPDLLGTYVVDMVAMFLAMPVVLFPALATDVLEKPALLGLLYSAGTVGSLVATATSGWTAGCTTTAARWCCRRRRGVRRWCWPG